MIFFLNRFHVRNLLEEELDLSVVDNKWNNADATIIEKGVVAPGCSYTLMNIKFKKVENQIQNLKFCDIKYPQTF